MCTSGVENVAVESEVTVNLLGLLPPRPQISGGKWMMDQWSFTYWRSHFYLTVYLQWGVTRTLAFFDLYFDNGRVCRTNWFNCEPGQFIAFSQTWVKCLECVSLTWRVTEGVRGGIRQGVERGSSTGTTSHWTFTDRRLRAHKKTPRDSLQRFVTTFCNVSQWFSKNKRALLSQFSFKKKIQNIKDLLNICWKMFYWITPVQLYVYFVEMEIWHRMDKLDF